MKKFVVSEKCIACGNCLLETKLLQEDAEGKAVPSAMLKACTGQPATISSAFAKKSSLK